MRSRGLRTPLFSCFQPEETPKSAQERRQHRSPIARERRPLNHQQSRFFLALALYDLHLDWPRPVHLMFEIPSSRIFSAKTIDRTAPCSDDLFFYMPLHTSSWFLLRYHPAACPTQGHHMAFFRRFDLRAFTCIVCFIFFPLRIGAISSTL